MNTSDFLDALMTHTAEIGATDNNNTTIRARFLLRTQQALEIVWNYDDWDFKQAIGSTMTLSASSYSCVSPSGFFQVGNEGQVWIQGTTQELIKQPENIVNRLRRASASRPGRPSFYCVAGQDSSTRRPKFVFDTLADANYTLELDHEIVCPTLADSVTAGSNGLDQFPNEHVRSVMLPAVIELAASDLGDGRVITELGPRGMAALKNMKAHRDQTRPETERLGDLGLRLYGMH